MGIAARSYVRCLFCSPLTSRRAPFGKWVPRTDDRTISVVESMKGHSQLRDVAAVIPGHAEPLFYVVVTPSLWETTGGVAIPHPLQDMHALARQE